MEHLDLAGVLTTPPQWNLPAFEQQDAIYLSSSRQMLEPIMEETSEDEECALNSWQQYEHSSSDVESANAERSESAAGESGDAGQGGASFWSSAESDTGSVIRIEITKDNDSTSERDFLCPAKRPRRCEESSLLPAVITPAEDEVVLRRPNLYADLKNNSLERFLNYDHLSRDSWGANSQQRSSLGSRRGFDDFYSDSDSLSYNSLSRSSSLIQFESLERQLLQDQHASMTSLGNSSPSLLSFDLQTTDDTQTKGGSNNSGNSSANNSRRGSQSSLLKKYESLDGRLHQTYYDLDKLNFDDMQPNNTEQFARTSNLKITSHMAELRSDSESSSEGSEESSRPQSVLSPSDSTDNEFFLKKFQRTNSQQSKKGKSSAENLSEDSGYCEPSLGFGLRRSKSQNLLQNYEKFFEEDEEMENKSLIQHHSNNTNSIINITTNSCTIKQQQQQTFIELNVEQAKHSIKINEFKNTNTRQSKEDVAAAEEEQVDLTITPPISPQLEFIRHKQRTEAHSPSPVSSEVSTSSSTSSKSTSNNSTTSSSSTSSSIASTAASSTSSATTCASKASFTWLMPSAGRTNSSRVYEEEDDQPQISINDLRELKTSNSENVVNFNGKLKFNNISSTTKKDENECLECRNILIKENISASGGEFQKGENKLWNNIAINDKNLICQQCKQKNAINFAIIDKSQNQNHCKYKTNKENPKSYSENLESARVRDFEQRGEFLNSPLALRKFQYTKSFSCENLRHPTEEESCQNGYIDFSSEIRDYDNSPIALRKYQNRDQDSTDHSLEYDSAVSTPESIKRFSLQENSPKNLKKYKNFEILTPENTYTEESEILDKSLEYTSATSTPESARRLIHIGGELRNLPLSTLSTDSDYSPLRIRRNLHNLMLNWPVKTSSVPNELNCLGRKKKLKKSAKTKGNKSRNSAFKDNELVTDPSTTSSEEIEDFDKYHIKRSLSWSVGHNNKEQEDLKQDSISINFENSSTSCSFYPETKNLGLLHQSYHNLATLNLDLDKDLSQQKIMAERRISSDYESEIICKNNFLLDELSAHYDRTASILNDKPVDSVDSAIKPPQRQRKSSSSSYTDKEETEEDKIQHVQLVIRKPPARQKKHQAQPEAEKSNSLCQDFTFTNIMMGGLAAKTFDQDPTNLRTSYAQSLEKCNFDCKEISQQDLNATRTIPKRRFHSQAANTKKRNMVSSTPNLNAFEYSDDIEDDMFVSSAHTSMHQLPLSQTQKPLGILLPAGSRTSFGKEVSFCPVVSKYCWQEQSSEECNDGNEDGLELGDDSEDELLDNADATVIQNTKENEIIAHKYNEEFLKKEQQKEINNVEEVSKEKAVLREIQKQQVENITVKQQQEEHNIKEQVSKENETQEQDQQRVVKLSKEHKEEQEKEQTEIETHKLELESQPAASGSNNSTELLQQTPVTVSLTTNVNNETLKIKPDLTIKNTEQQKRVNLNSSSVNVKPTVVVARPLSIQLPILTEPPINRAHHILYASQQMLDNFQKQQQHEEYEHYYKSQSTQNLSKMSEQLANPNSNLKNNNNEVLKSKFKHEEKHPNSKGFLSRFANGFRFSLRRNKNKKLQKDVGASNEEAQQSNTLPAVANTNKSNGVSNKNKSNSLPSTANKQPDFIHIPLKGPLPNRNVGNSSGQINGNTTNAGKNGNTTKNTTVSSTTSKKGAKTKETNNDKQKVTGKPPIPPQQQQQQQPQKQQSAQSALLQQQQQQPLVEVGFSRFYTDSNPTPSSIPSTTQDFLNNERQFSHMEQQQQQSCSNSTSLLTTNEENENMTAVNSPQLPTTNYEFTSPSRATVSQKTQMFNNLSRQSDSQTPQQQQNSQQQPKIGLIETNLDTHETVITGKTRSLINIGPNHHHNHNQQNQKLYAGNKRLHHHNANINSHHHHHREHDDDDDDYYDDNDDDEVVVRPDGTVVVIKNAGHSAASQAQQIASVRRPHKSMEFLLDKENQKDVMTTSEESHTELVTNDFLKPSSKPLRKKKLRRSLTWKKDNSLVESNAIFSTDSDSDCKTQNLKMLSCTLPKTKKCSNYVKKLLFKTLNSSSNSEHHHTIMSNNPELSILELDRSLIRQVNSPSKIKNAYTLTVMSSPSPHSESDFCESDLPRTPLKEASRSWPSLVEASNEEDSNLMKDKSVTTEFTEMAKNKLQEEGQKLLMDSFIDQGFETGSNDMESPMRLPRKTPLLICNKNATFNMDTSIAKQENPKNFSTPNKDKPVQQIFTAQFGAGQQNLISPIPLVINRRPVSTTMTMQAIQEDTSIEEDSEQFHSSPSSMNGSATFFSNDHMTNHATESPLALTHKVESSQFWISAGDFTAAFTIHPYEAERLMLLSNIYAQKCMESKEMHFGIDNQMFSMDKTSSMQEEIMKKVPKEKNCSQYWFSTADVLIPFTGKEISQQKIQTFFNYIREFMDATSDSLRFGIDTYEFSNNSPHHITTNTWSPPITPSIKTNDLDQSDVDSEEFEQSLTFSALGENQSDTASLKSDDLLNHQPNYSSSVREAESLEQIFEDARLLDLSKTQTDQQALESQFTIPEMLKTLQGQQKKLKSLEERMLTCTDSGFQKIPDINGSPEYMRKLRSIISAIDNIGRGNGFNACTIEQLESFMFFLSRYADLCLANCTTHIENILDVVMNQRSFQV